MPNIVLILIILEYIYMNVKRKFMTACWCLNPYYTGIHLHITTIWKGFIPLVS